MVSNAFALAVALALLTRPSPAAAPPPASSDDRPFTHVLQNLGRDLRALPSIDSATVLGVGVAAGVGLRSADSRLAAWAGRQGDSSYTRLGNVLGDSWTQGGAAVGLYVVGLAAHDRRTAHAGSDLIRAQILNGLFTRGLKSAARRTRPNGATLSWPSGHTSAAFASAAVLQGNFGWKAGVPAFAAAGFVGWTRIRDNAHWLTDVIAGATIGTITGLAVTSQHEHRNWTVIVAPAKDRMAVYIMRTGTRR